MSEASVAGALVTLIKGMTEFENVDVTDNDWKVLDNPSASAPFVLVLTSDHFNAEQQTSQPNTRWSIPIVLFEYFSEWSTTLSALRTRRQAIIDMMNTTTSRSVATAGVTIDRIYNEGLIEPYYDPQLDPEMLDDAVPIYLFQRIIMEVEEF